MGERRLSRRKEGLEEDDACQCSARKLTTDNMAKNLSPAKDDKKEKREAKDENNKSQVRQRQSTRIANFRGDIIFVVCASRTRQGPNETYMHTVRHRHPVIRKVLKIQIWGVPRPAWAVGSYSSAHQPEELPKSSSSKPSE